jgi:hypothetical protein
MNKRITFLLLSMLFGSMLDAQVPLANGGLELWRLKEFKCCGRNIDSPWDWGMTENLTGINYNKFVFRETDTNYVHSGIVSAMLYSDTTTLNNLVLIPGILSYGGMADSASTAVTIGPVIQGSGFPISSNPSQLNFYMLMNHQQTDTPYYIYLFTKWDSLAEKEDTLAYANIDIPDDIENNGRWVSYTSNINYTLSGTADTVRLIFFGGRFGNPDLQGNATFIDDISFYYPTTGLVSLDGEPVLQVYPNPVSGQLTIKTGQYGVGNNFTVFDVLGQTIKHVPVESSVTTLDVAALPAGEYFYRLSDVNNTMLTRGEFTIAK